jgi:hypothetical protein
MMTMRRVVVAPHLRKEVFLMALALLIELRVRVVDRRVLYSGIMSPLASSNIPCPINSLRSLKNNNMAMVLHNLIVLKINKVEVQIMRKQRQRQQLIRI